MKKTLEEVLKEIKERDEIAATMFTLMVGMDSMDEQVDKILRDRAITEEILRSALIVSGLLGGLVLTDKLSPKLHGPDSPLSDVMGLVMDQMLLVSQLKTQVGLSE